MVKRKDFGMGEIKYEDGVFSITGFQDKGISDYICNTRLIMGDHMDGILKIKPVDLLTYKFVFDAEKLWKFAGMVDWLSANCPNRRVIHLMRYCKNKRTRLKNMRRAMNIIGDIMDS